MKKSDVWLIKTLLFAILTGLTENQYVAASWFALGGVSAAMTIAHSISESRKRDAEFADTEEDKL